MTAARAKMQTGLAMLAAFAAAACQAQTGSVTRPVPPQGIYSNVFVSEQTGDLGGFEVRFYQEAGKQMAEFVLCEGWCNRAYVAEVTADGNAFRFSYIEELYLHGEDGATQIDGPLVEYRVRWSDAGLVYNLAYDGEPVDMDPAASVLAPLDEPFGLAVARSEE
jgi:hypothetical protein